MVPSIEGVAEGALSVDVAKPTEDVFETPFARLTKEARLLLVQILASK